MDWKEIVRGIAPSIGTALGGPAAGVGVKFLADKLLGKPNATEAEISAAVKDLAPAQQIELRRLDLEFKSHAADIGLDLVKEQTRQQEIAAQDRDSARNMQIKTRSWMPGVLAAIAIAAFVACTGIVFFLDIPEKRLSLVTMMLGVLIMLVKDVYAFTFGTTAEAERKDATIKHMWDTTP